MEILAYISFLAYALFYLPIIWANRFAKEIAPIEWDGKDNFSIIVPYYNEEDALPRLIDSLQESAIQPDEIIFVDDFSTDSSATLLRTLTKKLPHVKCIPNTNKPGKKIALTEGINHARNNIIVSTDADCLMHPNWLNKLIGTHVSNDNIFTFGLVEYISNDHWLGMYQWMESRALMASGMGLFRLKMPVMCNGANLVFNKDGWKEVGGYEGKKAILGGDDIFLMHALWKKDPTKIGYCLDEEAVVYTAPHKQFGKFMRQRKRWANKTGKYDLAFANIIPFLVAGVNLFILVCFILLLVSGEWGLAFGLLVAKALVDYYNIVSLKQGFRNCVSFVMILQYQLFQLIYPFLLPFFRSDWKRKTT
jgi:glycosyltransferase involved in cell wall biosynthesis